MNSFVRFWQYFKSLLHGKLDQWEDPEVIINPFKYIFGYKDKSVDVPSRKQRR